MTDDDRPRAILGDSVDLRDNSRLFGEVINVYEKAVRVRWDDGQKPQETLELTEDLTLIHRSI